MNFSLFWIDLIAWSTSILLPVMHTVLWFHCKIRTNRCSRGSPQFRFSNHKSSAISKANVLFFLALQEVDNLVIWHYSVWSSFLCDVTNGFSFAYKILYAFLAVTFWQSWKRLRQRIGCSRRSNVSVSQTCYQDLWKELETKTLVTWSQDQDLGHQVSRPRPWPPGLETKTKTLATRSRDRDQDLGNKVSRPKSYYRA